MTYIEFYDPSQPENICSSLVSKPDRIVFFCDSTKQFKRLCDRLHVFFEGRGWDIELKCKAVRQNDMMKLADLISQVVEEYGDCVIDLTGGSDMLLCAAGIVYERYKDTGLQFHRINFNNGVITDCDGDGKVIGGNPMNLSVEENIILYGGRVMNVFAKASDVREGLVSKDFIAQAKAAWEICKENPNEWNHITGLLGFITRRGTSDKSGLKFGIETETVRHALPLLPDDELILRMFRKLSDRNMLSDYSVGKNYLSVTYESEKVINLLNESGKALEMEVFLTAVNALDDNGEPIYNDVSTGIVINWETSDESGETFETLNEIDVLMMHTVTPVFVSCKNGGFKIDELYKLDSVAARFGLRHARKVLITTSAYTDEFRQAILQRAADMHIRLVENYHHLNDEGKTRVMRSAVK